MPLASAPLGAAPRLAAPALAAGLRKAAWLSADGEIEILTAPEAAQRVGLSPKPLVCHAPATAQRLNVERFAALDLLELYAFVRPASFCLPTPRGLAQALDLAAPHTLEAEAVALLQAGERLLAELAAREAGNEETIALAQAMARGAWCWRPSAPRRRSGTGAAPSPCGDGFP